MKKIFTICGFLLPLALFSQSKFKPELQINNENVSREILRPMKNVKAKVPRSNDRLSNLSNINYKSVSKINVANPIKVMKEADGQVYAISGNLDVDAPTLKEKCDKYLSMTSKYWTIENPSTDLILTKEVSNDNETHFTYNQQYKGLPIWNAELKLHAKNDEIYYSNGRTANIKDLDITPSINIDIARQTAQDHLSKSINIKSLNDDEQKLIGQIPHDELIIYKSPNLGGKYKLAYHITVIPNITDRWEYFVDAKTNEVIYQYRNACKFHQSLDESEHDALHNSEKSTLFPQSNEILDGPESGNGTDLLGVNRTVQSYRLSGVNYLIDATKSMFSAGSSNMPNDPIGAIWTLNAFNTSPEGNNFKYDHVTSSSATWNNPTAVSAHYNASVAYDYYKNTFNRNSINGSGGTIISLINVADDNGAGMDNAFWNGEAMFYGNGLNAFKPLARGLDVAGHEMTHGVVQSTANLEYQGESGALNESFADIFGAMIDRNDWQMGEDVVKTSTFPSGALRDLSNPHNGGTSLSSAGFQPAHYNERYTGTQDNGGVHINSGITNFAFYKFAVSSGVTKNIAEQVFYKALTTYLVKSSRFVDLRAAVIQSIKDLNYGTTVENAAAAAFDAVGIAGSGGGTGGSGTPGNYQNDLPINPGNDIIFFNDANVTKIYVTNPQGNPINVISNTAPISNVSASDDGAELIFVGKDKKIYYIFIDWVAGTVEEYVIQDQPIWRNAAISKDGFRVAALTALDNSNPNNNKNIDVYDFEKEVWKTYKLYNPTTGQGVNTDEIDYAGSLDWDYTGRYVIYDESVTLSGGLFGSINYWDVGILRAFEPSSVTFGDGQIIKLFSDLPDGISIGNPAFSKNSPYIIGFDLLDENDNSWSVLGVNSQTGDNDYIVQNNGVPGYPSYSRDDKKMIFNGKNGSSSVIKVVGLNANKFQSSGSPSILFNNATNGVWSATGYRNLSSNVDLTNYQIQIAPNPTSNNLNIDLTKSTIDINSIDIYYITGNLILSKKLDFGQKMINLDVNALQSGTFILKLNANSQVINTKFIKM